MTPVHGARRDTRDFWKIGGYRPMVPVALMVFWATMAA